jgi:DegV family protein with EDD domain
MTVRIVTDSSSDITQEEAGRLGITVVPVYLRFGHNVYRDGIDMDSDEFFRKMAFSPVVPVIAAPPPEDFSRVYRELARETREIVSIHVSRKHSSVFSAAQVAGETAAGPNCRIEVIDSGGVSMWQGLAAIAALRSAQTGATLQEVVYTVHDAVSRMRVLALLDTVKYYIRGGSRDKIAGAISDVESVLPFKLLCTPHDGEIHPTGLVLNRSQGIKRLRKMIRSVAHLQDAAIVHHSAPEEAQRLADYIASLFPGIMPRVTGLGPMLGMRSGPRALMTVLRTAHLT